MDEKYTLVCPFLTDDPLFTLGFEAGKIYAEMCAKPEGINVVFHSENFDQIVVMIGHMGYVMTMTSSTDDWVNAFIKKAVE